MTQVIRKPKRMTEAERNAYLRGLETELLEDSLSVSRDTLRFREIDPGATEPPADWIEEVGLERATERFRCAQAGWMTRKDAPVGVQIAMQLGVGILKSRAQKDVGAKTLNVQVVQVTAPLPKFPELVLEAGEK